MVRETLNSLLLNIEVNGSTSENRYFSTIDTKHGGEHSVRMEGEMTMMLNMLCKLMLFTFRVRVSGNVCEMPFTVSKNLVEF